MKKHARMHYLIIINFRVKVVFLVTLMILLLMPVSAYAGNYRLEHIGTLSQMEDVQQQWLDPIANPANKYQLYVANSLGEIFIFDTTLEKSPFFELKKYLKHTKEPSLTAFTLHPDFAKSRRKGFGIFYTAHVELFNESASTARLQEESRRKLYTHDAVITEWKFNYKNNQKADLSSQREIIRISIADKNDHITQLAFNPHAQTWSEEPNLLHIVLKNNPKLQELRLYSGAVLRINPEQSGKRNYTVPYTNPFVHYADVEPELFIIGAQNINGITWLKSYKNLMLITHQYLGRQLLSTALPGDNWQHVKPKKTIWENKIQTPVISNVYYRGRYLPDLRAKVLTLSRNEQNWQLDTFDLENKSELDTPTASNVWIFKMSTMDFDHDVSIHNGHNDEVLVFNHTTGDLYLLLAYNIASQSSDKVDNDVTSALSLWFSKNAFILLIIVLVIVLLLITLLVIGNMIKRPSFLLRNKYTRFEISDSKRSILLYKYLKTTAKIEIQLSNIIVSEILVNGVSASIISAEPDNGFNDLLENTLRGRLAVLDTNTQTIMLRIVDSNTKEYLICMYMLKNGRRITDRKSSKAVKNIVDWSWFIAQRLNAEGTTKRRMTVKSRNITAKKRPNRTSHNKKILSAVEKVDAQNEQQNEQQNEIYNDSKMSVEIVNAIDKLSKLKQKGEIADIEYEQAKNKLLRNLGNIN